MTWTQSYTPLGNLAASALVAAVPVVVLLGLLAFSKVKAHSAALLGLGASVAVAILVYHMPVKFAGLAALFGAAYGLFPIGWIVLSAIFVYDITCHTGQFEIVKHSIAGLADDRRIQAVLIAFCFGSFLEGAAGFGTPVAICAAMLIGLGFRPLPAAGLALIGNTAPVAFGGLGIPIFTLSTVTGISPETLAATIGWQLAPFSLIIPFWLVCAMAGWRATLEVWPACLTAGLSFSIVQLTVSNLHGPLLVAIASSIASIISVLILLRFWKPKTVWRFDHEEDPNGKPDQPLEESSSGHFMSTGPDGGSAIHLQPAAAAVADFAHEVDAQRTPRAKVIKAWMPWVIVSALVFTWGLPPVKAYFNKVGAVKLPIPGLHQQVFRAPPVVPPNPKPEDAIFTFNWLSATGTSLMLAAIASGFMLGLSPLKLAQLFARSLHRVRTSLLTISAMMAIGYTTRFAGLDATLGLAFASTGGLFPFFSPLLGWLGVALTGSDTASNVLFGNLQQITAGAIRDRLHLKGLTPVLAASANSTGGVMGKMIDAQSIVVASVATNQTGHEGQILRYVFFHSIALAVLVGLLVMGQVYLHR